MVGSTRSYEMAKRLVSMGHEVSILTSWRQKRNPLVGHFRMKKE